MLNLKTIYPISIDFDSNDLYAVQLKGFSDGVKVQDMACGTFNGSLEDVVQSGDKFVSFLKKLIKEKNFRGRSALLNVPSNDVYTFPISFEASGNESVEERMMKEVGGYLSFPMNEAIIDYPSLEKTSSDKTNQYNAIITAVKKNVVEQYIRLIKKAGLSVEAVDFGITSLIRLHGHLSDFSENPVIICNVGQLESSLCVVTKNSILAGRNVNWGIQTVFNRLKENLGLPDNKDKDTKNQIINLFENYGLFYEDRLNSRNTNNEEDNTDSGKMDMYRSIFQILAPSIDALINEFHQIFAYVRAGNRKISFREIAIYGQANTILHLDKYIEKRLNIPTKCVNPINKGVLSRNSGLPDKAEEAPFSRALGLALRKVTWL